MPLSSVSMVSLKKEWPCSLITLWLRWVVCLFFGLAGSVSANKTLASKSVQNLSQEARALIRESSTLQTDLRKKQERLTVILDQLGGEKILGKPVDAKAAAVVTTHLEYFSRHFRERISAFSSDLSITTNALIQPPKIAPCLQKNLITVLGSFFIAIFSVGVGGKFLRHRIERSLLRLKLKTFVHLERLNTLLVAPIPLYFSICLVLATAMHAWGGCRLNPWNVNACALLPMHFYCIWAMHTWVGMTWMPNRPSQGFIIMSPEKAHRSVFWLRMVLVIYGFSACLLGMIVILTAECPEKKAIIRTILDMGMMASCWCIHKGLSWDESDLHLNAQPKKILRVMTVLRWGFIALTALWLMGRVWFLKFLFPLLMTASVWIFLFPTKEMLRYCRLRFLWKRRNKDFMLKRIVISNKIMIYFADFLAYGLVVCIWYPYIEMWIDAGYWTFLASLKSVVFSGLFHAGLILAFALFIIRIGDRILKYYVEERYTNDSLENNFLVSRLKTLMAMLRTSLRVVVWIPSSVLMFGQFGDINFSTWVASIGVAGFGLTFGLQHIVKDFISGFFIILENNLMVGDEVEIDTRSGKVESITIRTLKIRSDQGMLLTIPFGSIQVIGNKNRLFSAVVMNISVGYNENLERIQGLIEKAFALVKRAPIFGRRIVGPLEIRGVNEVTSYSVIFQVKITTAPNMQDSIRRAFNRQLKQIFDEAGIVVPVPPASFSKPISSLTNTVL